VSQLFEIEELPVTVIAGEAGSVEISAVDGALQVSRTNGADGWSVVINTQSGQSVSVTFSDGGVTVLVNASITEGGDVVVTTTADDGDDSGGGDGTAAAVVDPTRESFTVGTAGIVVVEYTDGNVTLVSAETNPGWELVSDDDDDDDDDANELRVEFRSADRGARFDAEFEDGALKIKIREFDLDADGNDAGNDGGAKLSSLDGDDGYAAGVQRFEINGERTQTFDFVSGSVTIVVTETSIEELTGEANDDWIIEDIGFSGRAGRVDFQNEAGDKVQFKAEVAGGELQVKIQLIEMGDGQESEFDGSESGSGVVDGDDDDDRGHGDFVIMEIEGELTETIRSDAGTVTIVFHETGIEALEFEAAHGWTVEEERISGREARVVFESEDGDRIQFKAEVAGGRLLVRFAEATVGIFDSYVDDDGDAVNKSMDDDDDDWADNRGNGKGNGKAGRSNDDNDTDDDEPDDADDD
jgi:hypothetical protein